MNSERVWLEPMSNNPMFSSGSIVPFTILSRCVVEKSMNRFLSIFPVAPPVFQNKIYVRGTRIGFEHLLNIVACLIRRILKIGAYNIY